MESIKIQKLKKEAGKGMKKSGKAEIKSEEMNENEILLIVVTPPCKRIRIKTDVNEPIWDIKLKIQDQEGIPADQQRLIFCGKHLRNFRRCVDYGIYIQESTLNLVVPLRPGPVADSGKHLIFIKPNGSRQEITCEYDNFETYHKAYYLCDVDRDKYEIWYGATKTSEAWDFLNTKGD